MVNSGAIMSASILLYLLKPGMNMAQKYDYVFDFFKVNKQTKQHVDKLAPDSIKGFLSLHLDIGVTRMSKRFVCIARIISD